MQTKLIKKYNKEVEKVTTMDFSSFPLLTKLQEMEWMDVFEIKKEDAQVLKAEIDQTDKEIDKMIYEFCNLTNEEIDIIENS